MKLHFHSPAFDAQLLRAASYTYFKAADIGECLSIASRIQEGDFESWQSEWSKIGARLMNEGLEAENRAHFESAKECFLKASNYYRASLFFDYRPEKKERLKEVYNLHTSLFSKAMKYFTHPAEVVNIPFENEFLPGIFYSSTESCEARPLIIVTGGYDSTHQESYFSFIPAAISRKFHVLAFDGPGQGELLIKKDTHMRHDWETVISSVFQFLEKRKDVDFNKVALYGASWGGFLAPRAACFEKRIKALIANPGQYDLLDNVRCALSQDNEGACPEWEEFMQAAMKDKFFSAKIQSKMFVHGVHTPNELLHEWENYSLKTLFDNISCPTLICDSENENLAPGQAKVLFEMLKCKKEYLLFKAADGAGEHTGLGNLSLVTRRILDWLDETFNNTADDLEPSEKHQDVISLGYTEATSKM